MSVWSNPICLGHLGLGRLFAATLALLVVAAPARAEDLGALAARIKRSVVLLELADGAGERIGIGTGFVVSADGKVVTNHHVIAEAAEVTAVLGDGRRVVVRGVLAMDEEHDLALLALEGTGYQPLVLDSARGLAVGDEVVVIGSPAGLAGSLSTGVVSALRGEAAPNGPGAAADHPRAWALQITAAISPGSSGSPVVTVRGGSVVGIAVGQRTDGEGLNFAVPADHARALVVAAAVEPEALPGAATRGSVLLNLLISAVFFAMIGLAAWLVPRYRRRSPSPSRRASN
ncbi:MAG: trypsin-like peptidase domain-containing protein [Polyangiaceae bacterium]|nr:trypsin-like peptidase domain-containing protein [Polyangiaceae bacterium]